MNRTFLLLSCLVASASAVDLFPGLRRLRQNTIIEIQSSQQEASSKIVSDLWEIDVVETRGQDDRRTNEFFTEELFRNLEYDMSMSMSMSM